MGGCLALAVVGALGCKGGPQDDATASTEVFEVTQAITTVEPTAEVVEVTQASTAVPSTETPPPPPTPPRPTPTPAKATLDLPAAPPTPTPAIPTATLVPENYDAPSPPSEADDRSTAIFFLRDRSQSALELCGEERFKTMMAGVPTFFNQFLANDPQLAGIPIYLGLNEYPDWVDPYVLRPLRAGIPSTLEVFKPDEWADEVDEYWDEEKIKKSGFPEAVNAAMTAFDNLEAIDPASEIAHKHLVVFGDGQFNFDYESEWADIYDKLVETLSARGVHLHYVLYNCLPADLEDDAGNWDDIEFGQNYKQWEKVTGIVRNPTGELGDEQWVTLYSWAEETSWPEETVNRKAQKAELENHLLGDYATWPLPILMNALAESLVGPLVEPPAGAEEDAVPPPHLLLTAGSIPSIPLSGAAGSTEVNVVSVMNGNEDAPHLIIDGDADTKQGRGEDLKYLYTFDLEPKAECAQHEFTIQPRNDDSELTYPALVWWRSESIALPDVRLTFDNVVWNGAGQLVASLQREVSGQVAWVEPDQKPDFLEEALNACFRVDVTSDGPAELDLVTARAAELEGWEHRFRIPYDPVNGQPLTLSLGVQIYRNETLPHSPGATPPKEKWALVEWRAVPTIRFVYHPALGPGPEVKLDGDIYTITVPVDFTSDAYYQPTPLGDPRVYLLTQPGEVTTGKDGCESEIQPNNEPNDGTLPVPQGWPYLQIYRHSDEANYVVVESGGVKVPDNGAPGEFHLRSEEVDACRFAVLSIYWPGYESHAIHCTIADRRCVQQPDVPDLARPTAMQE